jgi:hypothetical protein
MARRGDLIPQARHEPVPFRVRPIAGTAGHALTTLAPGRDTRGDFVNVKSIRPEGAEPIPARSGTHRMGTVIARFVAILALVIVVLMLVWYR